MKPIRTPESNTVFNPAEGDEENVEPMHAEVREGDGIYSTWDLTGEEREQVAQGAMIVLGVAAAKPPPVGMQVVPPPGTEWSDELKTFVCPVAEP